jgi:hypothetical protein
MTQESLMVGFLMSQTAGDSVTRVLVMDNTIKGKPWIELVLKELRKSGAAI